MSNVASESQTKDEQKSLGNDDCQLSDFDLVLNLRKLICCIAVR